MLFPFYQSYFLLPPTAFQFFVAMIFNTGTREITLGNEYEVRLVNKSGCLLKFGCSALKTGLKGLHVLLVLWILRNLRVLLANTRENIDGRTKLRLNARAHLFLRPRDACVLSVQFSLLGLTSECETERLVCHEVRVGWRCLAKRDDIFQPKEAQ